MFAGKDGAYSSGAPFYGRHDIQDNCNLSQIFMFSLSIMLNVVAPF